MKYNTTTTGINAIRNSVNKLGVLRGIA